MTTYPSEISLHVSYPPLAATMHKSEAEAAATLMVRVCQVKGDRWQEVTLRDLGKVAKADLDKGVEPLKSLSGNPFWRPDFFEIVKRGYARWTEPEKVEGNHSTSAIEFTEEGLKALEKHRTHQKPPG